ncbi:MAG: 30S ribosomal protein S6e [Candidatus Bathyarchaeia archaeon]
MAKFKLSISDPKTGRCQAVEVEGPRAQPLIGRRIGEVIDGSIANRPRVSLQITGGSDKDGTPMRPDVHGGVRVDAVLSRGVGFRPRQKGERRRKLVRGSVITEDIVQVNMKIVH